jgi:hypothetical protein
MKIKADLIWSIVLLGIAIASFLLGMKKSTLKTEDELEETRREIRLLESKNQQLSEELMSRGIYSYPQANVVSDGQDAVAMVLITLNGKDAIQNLKLRREIIFNNSLTSGFKEELTGKFTDLGTLKPHNPTAFEIPITAKEVALQLNFESKSKKWQQYIWIKRNEVGNIKSFWVITNQNSVIIDKHMDPGFPTDKEGTIMLFKDKQVRYPELELNSIFKP